MQEFNIWIQAIIALAALYVAYTAKAVAKRQAQAQEQQLDIALYERRYRVYRTILDTTKKIFTTQEPNPNLIVEMNREITEYEFLFDKEMRDYIDSIRKRLIEYVGVIGDEDTSDRGREIKLECRKWCLNAYDEITQRFLRYLDFRQLQARK